MHHSLYSQTKEWQISKSSLLTRKSSQFKRPGPWWQKQKRLTLIWWTGKTASTIWKHGRTGHYCRTCCHVRKLCPHKKWFGTQLQDQGISLGSEIGRRVQIWESKTTTGLPSWSKNVLYRIGKWRVSAPKICRLELWDEMIVRDLSRHGLSTGHFHTIQPRWVHWRRWEPGTEQRKIVCRYGRIWATVYNFVWDIGIMHAEHSRKGHHRNQTLLWWCRRITTEMWQLEKEKEQRTSKSITEIKLFYNNTTAPMLGNTIFSRSK